jgi:hypothetical protein
MMEEILQTSANAGRDIAARASMPGFPGLSQSERRVYLVPRPARPCEYCGKPMENPRADQRFCRNPRHRRPHLIAPPAFLPCGFCGEPIDKPRRDQKFCRKPRRCAHNAKLAQLYTATRARFVNNQVPAPAAGEGIVDIQRSIATPLVMTAAPSAARVSGTMPMIEVLVQSMPAPGTSWAREARAQWMTVLERTLDALYPED